MSDFMVSLMPEPYIKDVDGWYNYRHSMIKAANDRIDAVELAPDVALIWAEGFDLLPEGMRLTEDEIAQAVKEHAKGFVARFLSGDYYNEHMDTVTVRGYKYVAVGGTLVGEEHPAEDFDEVGLINTLGIFDAPFTLGAIA